LEGKNVKTIKALLVINILFCSFLIHAEGPHLNQNIFDPNNTWLGCYDAGLNTLPEQQGWTVVNNLPDNPPVILNDLLISDTTVLQYLYWSRTDKYICFPADQGVIVEFELKINTSQYVEISENRWRTGYAVWITDYQGRTCSIGIADTGVILSNHFDWIYTNSSLFVPYNTTDGFHVYRFVVQNNIAQLKIDGNPVVSLAVGAVGQDTPNTILFGDGTYHAAHNAELAYLRYGVIKKTGDTGNDGLVDMTDLEMVVYNWLAGNCGCMSCCDGADLNHSGKVDLEDLAILALGWLG
jgi:hypothetical protein